jgi:hypothetical protein
MLRLHSSAVEVYHAVAQSTSAAPIALGVRLRKLSLPAVIAMAPAKNVPATRTDGVVAVIIRAPHAHEAAS